MVGRLRDKWQEIVLNIALCGDWAGNGWFRSGEARRTGFTHGLDLKGMFHRASLRKALKSRDVSPGCGPLIFEPTKDCCSRFATSREAWFMEQERTTFATDTEDFDLIGLGNISLQRCALIYFPVKTQHNKQPVSLRIIVSRTCSGLAYRG